MNELTNVALRCLIMILATAITTVLIPYIRSRISEEKWVKLQEYTQYAVRYAEQMYTPEEWQEKKTYVYHYVLQKADEMGIGLDEKDIDLLVEGVVNLIKKG